MVQLKESIKITKEWGVRKKNDPTITCDHKGCVEKEYDLGTDTGDKVCTRCGEVVNLIEQNDTKTDKR